MLIATLAGLFLWLALPLDWETVRSYRSPGGQWTAYHLRSRSEAGDAPYGDHVVLSPGNQPLGRFFGEVVFAAYCMDGAGIHWLADSVLQVQCRADRVVKRLPSLDGVTIRYRVTAPPSG